MAVVTTAPTVAATAGSSSYTESRVQDLKCELLISDFIGTKNPSTEEMQEFAQCVERIHPSHEHEQNKKDFVQVALIFSLVSFAVGLAWSRWLKSDYLYRDTHQDVMCGVLFTAGGWLIVLVAYVFYWAFS